MAKYQTLCEYLAECGGLRSFHNQRNTMGSGDLRAIGAAEWHRAKPFRKKLLRLETGMCPDTAALVAWEAGYFPECGERPDVSDLIDAIDRELSGKPVYTAEDSYAMYAEAAAEFDRERLAQGFREGVEALPAGDVSGRVVPADSEALTGLSGDTVYIYAQTYLNKKGHEGRRYLAKAFHAGEKKHAWHRIFLTHDERMNAVNEFFAANGEAF
jgi:hypothetical protein